MRRMPLTTRESARIIAAYAFERFETGLNYNPFTGRAIRDPYPQYCRFRERDPIHRSRPARGWILFRHADCAKLLRDPRMSSDDRNYVGYRQMQRTTAALRGLLPTGQRFEPPMIRRDPPDHTRLRKLVSKAFTPRAIEGVRARIEKVSETLIDDLARKPRPDLIADYAVPLPITIIAEMLGIPPEDREVFKTWSDTLVGFLDPLVSKTPSLRRTAHEFFEYMDALAKARRQDPADDLLSALVLAEEEGDHLSLQELHGTLALLLAAGNETTTNLIGNGMLALIRHPEQMARLRVAPNLAPRAVEELLRWDSPVQLTMRIPVEPLELRGHRLETGQAVIFALGSANRDPEAFPEPETLDIDRFENPHLSFGHGIHFCLGAQLARLEGQVAITQLLDRFSSIQLAVNERELRWRRLTFLRGLKRLPVTLSK